MNLPTDRRYTASHEWARKDVDGSILVGISDFAQESLGDVVFVELPALGKQCTAGQVAAVVESVKAASDIYAPVAGEVREVNESLRDAPENINQDAWGAWIFRLAPGATGFEALLDAAAYGKLLEAGH